MIARCWLDVLVVFGCVWFVGLILTSCICCLVLVGLLVKGCFWVVVWVVLLRGAYCLIVGWLLIGWLRFVVWIYLYLLVCLDLMLVCIVAVA